MKCALYEDSPLYALVLKMTYEEVTLKTQQAAHLVSVVVVVYGQPIRVITTTNGTGISLQVGEGLILKLRQPIVIPDVPPTGLA